jgi:flagellar biosynthesis/type III secretory pathway protein FliH
VIDADLGGARALRWIGDSNVERGGCLTEGRERIIDGRVDTALERAYRTIAQIQA